MEYFVYIIYSQSKNKYYTGYSHDPVSRLEEHNLGATLSTRSGRPWEIVYKEKCEDKTAAIKRENKIKKMKSKKYIVSLISNNSVGTDVQQSGSQDADRKRQH